MTRKLPTQIVGNVGLYYVCYRLSLLQWNAMPTARNARGIDILAYSEDGSRKLSVQVKALSRRDPVPLGKGLENLIADWVIVLNGAASFPLPPTCFVLTPAEIAKNVHVSKDGKATHWLQPKQYDQPQFRERWERIGLG